MKIHELAKEFDIKYTELLSRLVELGFIDYKGPSADIDEETLVLIREKMKTFLQAKAELPEIDQHNVMKCAGIFYNFEKGNYETILFELTPSKIDALKKEVPFEIQTFSTIYRAKIEFLYLLEKFDFFRVSILEKIRKKIFR